MNEFHMKPEVHTFLSTSADFTHSHSVTTFEEKKIPFLPIKSVHLKCGEIRHQNLQR